MAADTRVGVLALVGGREWDQTEPIDTELLELSGQDTVTVLPTAAAFERPELAVEFARRFFSALGAEVEPVMVLKREDGFKEEALEKIRQARFVYLAGGSPLHLRSVLSESPLFDALLYVLRKGGVLAGSSAGAMVLGDPMVDPRGGAFTLGLGLIKRFAVLPHFDTWPKERIKRSLTFAPSDVLLAGLEERTALLRMPDGTWKVAGRGSAHLYLGGKEVALDALSEISLSV